MRVYREDPREVGLRRSQDVGSPHSNDLEKMVEEGLWVRVAPSGRSPVTWILMKRGSEGCEAKGRGLDTKRYQAR
jgi:hypothetical protein